MAAADDDRDWCVVIRSSMRLLNLWLQTAMEWLHECDYVVLPCASRDAGLRRDVAKRIVVAAWMLQGRGFGR